MAEPRPIKLGMAHFESIDNLRRAPVRLDSHIDLMRLLRIFHVEAVFEARRRATHRGSSERDLFGQRVENVPELVGAEARRRRHDAAGSRDLDRRAHHAEGGKDAWHGWDNDFRDPNLGGERSRVLAGRSAERHQRKIPRIDSLFDRHPAYGGGHARVDHAIDAGRRFLNPDPETIADPLHGFLGEITTERHQAVWLDETQDQIGVGDGAGLSAAAIAGRSRLGAGALRADAQRSALINPDDAAAASADRLDIDRWRLHRQTPSNLECVLQLEAPVADDRDIKARAAHVDGDEIAPPRRLADEGASEDPAGRSRDAQRHRTLRRLLARLYAAFGAEIANNRFAIDAFLQRLDVATDAGHRIDVRDRCVGPFVFANFSANRRRERQGQIRRKLAHDFFDNPLVSIVAIGVKKADSDPLDVQREGLSDDLLHLRAVDRVDDGGRRAQPFVDLEATIAGNQRRGLSPGQISACKALAPAPGTLFPERCTR